MEAAQRCDWERMWEQVKDVKISRKNEPLFIPKMVNLSFACELYLKAIAEAKKVNFSKIHKLDKLFEKLPEEDRKAIFDIWRENVTDCDYEWVGSVVSLESSFTWEQFAKLSPWCANNFGERPPIYDGFLMQFAVSLKVHTEKLLGLIYNS